MLHIRKLVVISLLLVCTIACQYRTYHVAINHEPKEKAYTKKINLALVLSGAGSKGITHAGVIAAFEAHHIPIDLIVGSSAGSLVGILYADSKDIVHVTDILMTVERSAFLDGRPSTNFARATLLNDPANFYFFRKFLHENLRSTTFEQLKIPVAAIATNVTHNEPAIFNSGHIAPAIMSSCAIPGLYRPILMNDSLFIDGGISSPVPVPQAMKFHPNITVAVNISSSPSQDPIQNNVMMLYKSSWVTHYQFAKLQSNMADFVIDIDATGYDWLSDPTIADKEKLFQLGFQAAENVIKQNKTLLELSKNKS